MNFETVNHLRLKEVFADIELFQAVKADEDWLNVLFECDNRGTLFVVDDAEVGHAVYVRNTNGLGRDKVFTVINRAHADVFLWHIDGVMYKKTSKCDCALLTDKELDFVEFKTDADNNSPEARFENYRKAGEQLKTVYLNVKGRFSKKGLDLNALTDVLSYAVFNPTVPSDNALKKSISARFLKDTGIKLRFDNRGVLGESQTKKI